MKSAKFKLALTNTFYVAIASLLYAIAMNMFIEKAKIIIGGATGIATLLKIHFNLPIGVMIIAINIPLVIASYIVYGKKFILNTVIGVFTTSVAIDVLSFFPITTDDPLLCALFGGVTLGASLGILYARGFNTGGSDLAVFLIKHKLKLLSNGTLLLIIDGLIVAVSAIVLKSFQLVFYSAISIYVETKTIDYIVGGFDRAHVTFIVSGKQTEIAEKISAELERGVTLIDSKGWYSGKEGQIIMCVIRPSEVFSMKKLVYSVDKSAFIIFASASEVLGEGFKNFLS